MLRIALATVFGFMSLVHGPVMTFAKASPAAAHHAMNARGHHHGLHHQDHATPARSPTPAEPESAPVCHAFGCFIALDAVALRAPPAILNPIGTLCPGPARALPAGEVEPAVPPPRLHV